MESGEQVYRLDGCRSLEYSIEEAHKADRLLKTVGYSFDVEYSGMKSSK